MKVGDLVVFDADIVKRIFPGGLFDRDMGTIISECIPSELKSRPGAPAPYIELPCWWILWWE